MQRPKPKGRESYLNLLLMGSVLFEEQLTVSILTLAGKL